MMQGGVVEDPNDVARPIDGHTAAQTALFINKRGESLRTGEAFLTDLHPQVADLRVASGRGVDRFTNR